MPAAGQNQPILTVTEAAQVQRSLWKLPDAQMNESEQRKGLPACMDP